MRFFCLLLFFLLFYYLSYCSFVYNIYTSTLSGSQILSTHSYGVGNAFCLFTQSDTNPGIECEIQHNVSDVTSIIIASGKRGESGPSIFEFIDVAGNYANGKWEFVDIETYSKDEQINDYLHGYFYILVESEDNSIRNCRGQIEQGSRFFSKLNSENTIPLASGTTATGIATATYSPTLPTRRMSLTVVHNVVRSTSLELHEGAQNQVGDELYLFDDYSNIAYDNVQLSVTEEELIYTDLLYLNIASISNPTGDIRGQLETIDYIPYGSFTSFLTGEQVLPSPVNTEHTGSGIVSYNCNTKILEYIVMHSIEESTGCVIAVGAANQVGTILDSLPTSKSPIYGSIRLNNEQIQALYSSEMFFQVYINDFPVIRGAISVSFDYFAYLSGSNELPSVSTPSKGCALARLVQNDDDTILDFVVFHNIQDALSIDIRRGAEGISGPIELSLDSLDSTIDGTPTNSPVFAVMTLDDDDLSAFENGYFYLEIPSTSHLTGEIRGQFRRLDPCTVEGVSYSYVENTSENVFSFFSLGNSHIPNYNIIYDNSSSYMNVSIWFLIIFLFLSILF